MQRTRKKRLILVGLILGGVALSAALALTALNQNINLFYSPSQVAAAVAPKNTVFRLGGMVVDGSVQRNSENLAVQFDLTDTAETVTVRYSGILPDLFREGQGIVALGRLSGTLFVADQVLAKHDETYMSPEVSEALKAANKKIHNPASTDSTN